MAILGIQLVLTMVMLSILHRFAIHYSFARWLLAHRLVRYLQPSEQQIKQSIATLENEKKAHQQVDDNKNGGKHGGGGKSKSNKQVSHRGKKGRSDKNKSDVNMVSKKLSLTLEAERIHPIDLIQLNFYKEYQWLIDFALYASLVYIISEVQYYLIPGNREMNLSLIWCLLVIGFTTKLLLSITGIYFQGNDDAIGERSMCLVSGGLFFLFSMIVLIADENFLEFGLNPAYSSFNSSATQFFHAHGLHESTKGVTSKLLFKFWLAVWSGLIGALFIFPGLRFAQMHKDSLEYSEGKPIRQLLFHSAFISPLFIILLWVKPLGRGYLTEKDWPNRGVLMTSVSFDTLRIVIILAIMLFRLILMPKYLQAYLNLAPRKLSRLTRESGKIKTEVIQRTVSGVFFYLCVVCLQYVCPLLLILFTGILMKNMGDYQWTSLFTGQTIGQSESYRFGSSEQFSLQELKAIFNPIFFRGVLGYMSWWLSVVWFTTSVIGFIYHSYFSRESEIS